MAKTHKKGPRGATPIKLPKQRFKRSIQWLANAWHWQYLIIASILVVAIGVAQQLPRYLEQWPINHFEITGDLRYWDQQQLNAEIAWLKEESFFSVDLTQVHQQLSKLPLIQQVKVRKAWPSTIVVQANEAIPMAIWNEVNILTVDGNVVPIPDDYLYPERLVFISGPEVFTAQAIQIFRASQLNLKTKGIELLALTMSPSGSVELELSNRWHVELGQIAFQQRIERLGHLLSALDDEQVVKVDLRYGKGAAIQWHASEGVNNGPNA